MAVPAGPGVDAAPAPPPAPAVAARSFLDPCDRCPTRPLLPDELPPLSPHTTLPGGRYHYNDCRCPCHRRRTDVGAVGYLTASLHAMADYARGVDPVELEKVVGFLAVTDVRFRTMLTSLCHEAVDEAHTYGTLERVVAARSLLLKRATAEADRGTPIVLEGGRPAGPGGDAGGPGGG